jgi:hypothetical protein
LGWPSADDVAALHARIAALEQALAPGKLVKAAAPAKRQAAKQPVAKPPAAKRGSRTGQGAKAPTTQARAASRSPRSPQR